MLTAIDFYLMLPECLIFVMAVLLMLAGLYTSEEKGRKIVHFGAPITLVSALYFIVFLPYGEPVSLLNDMIVVDGLTRFAKALAVIAALFSLVLASQWLQSEKEKRFEFPILLLLATLGMLLLISSANLLSLYLGLELMSLSLYVMTAFHRDDRQATEAGMKYFVLGSLASGFILFGISYIYGFTGSTGFADLATALQSVSSDVTTIDPQSLGVMLGLVFVLAGFCFKLSVAPFHMWTPDVYQGAPTAVTGFFATAPKVAGVFILLRVLAGPFADMTMQWQQIILFVSIASMVVGALGAISQRNIKRMLAFSSVGHVGYALMAVLAASDEGAQSLLIYFSLYIFMSLGAFGCVLLMQRDGVAVENIEELGGASRQHPLFAALLAILMFSLAGIPPLAGFFGKFYVFLAAMKAGYLGVAIIGVLSSVVAAFYYLRVVKVMYFDAERDPFTAEANLSLRLMLMLCGVVSAAYVFLPAPLIKAAQVAAGGLWQ